ncbi:MAG: AbrB/MazE/SpoVT family DNA-binding domain-containing protein [Phaeodactylibacter sp.]|nr:AbrB/MazE/SpoVT family DNA-binding domain-containing protein [Phaeodactylibacter sp.]
MTTTLDKYGRILIPKRMRELLGITPQTQLVITEEGNKLIIEPVPEENPYEEKDNMLVFVGELESAYERLIEQDREERDNKILGL